MSEMLGVLQYCFAEEEEVLSRVARVVVPGFPHHVRTRGINGADCFSTSADRIVYLKMLSDSAAKFGCEIHAYVLMTNHVHLLVTPKEQTSLSGLMHLLGSRYASYFNKRNDREGGLFQGRYWSCVVGERTYLLTCHIYIELNPVRAGMVQVPEDHQWSSVHQNAFGIDDPIITPHSEYMALASNLDSCRLAYRGILGNPPGEKQLTYIRHCLNKTKVFGSMRFQHKIERMAGRSITYRPRGRPKK